MMRLLQREYKGILLSAVIGLTAYFISGYLPSSFSSILIALLLGIVLSNLITLPDNVKSGVSFTGSKLLEVSILFLAFSINYTNIARLGACSFIVIAVMIVAMLLFTYYLAIKIKCPGSTGWLVGFGTTICGSSAIAALAPSVSKNKEDVGIAMAVVNAMGSIGMVLMPVMLMKTQLSNAQMGLLLGGTLHSVGNVAGAGYVLGNEVGEVAITIKLARVAMLSPALIFFNFLVNRHNVSNWKEHFKLPWYLQSFIAITLLSSIVSFHEDMLQNMETIGKVILTIAMSAIGLKLSIKQIYQSGRKGLLFGLIVFVAQILILGALMLVL